MHNLKHIQNLYFLGIGGIGMSALARYFYALGKNVSGYDKTASLITNELAKEGIFVMFDDNLSEIPKSFLDKENTLVVYTPAVAKNNSLLKHFQNNGFNLKKRAEVLGQITHATQCLAVAGTHGKTTTSAILGHLMAEANLPVTAFLGGIAENYNSNLIQKGTEISVVEADEFDRSFLQLNPLIVGITSMDADHLDIYEKAESLTEAFTEFADKVPKNGTLLFKKGLPLSGTTVAVDQEADFSAQNIRIENGSYTFDLKTPEATYPDFEFHLPGRHNLFNATLALSMALSYGVAPEKLKLGLATFRGVKRRFSYKIKTSDFVFIDDYAHHPAEIESVFQTVEEMYPEQKNMVIFQPHLYSRTRDFADEFASALEKFDEVILLDIYPAREEPITGVSSQWLLDKINHHHKKLIAKETIGKTILESSASVVLMLGAGDIGNEIESVKGELLTKKIIAN